MEMETRPKIVPPSEMFLIVNWTFNKVVLIQLPICCNSITLVSLVAWYWTSPRAFFWCLGEDGHRGHDLIVHGGRCGCPEHWHFDITPSHGQHNCITHQKPSRFSDKNRQEIDSIQVDCRRSRGIWSLEKVKIPPQYPFILSNPLGLGWNPQALEVDVTTNKQITCVLADSCANGQTCTAGCWRLPRQQLDSLLTRSRAREYNPAILPSLQYARNLPLRLPRKFHRPPAKQTVRVLGFPFALSVGEVPF